MDLPFDPVIPLLGIYLKEPQTLIQKTLSTSTFIVVLFTIAKIWKSPSVYQQMNRSNNYGTLHSGILLGYKKEESFTLCDSMDGPGEHHAK